MTEKEKKDYNYVIDQLCEAREIIAIMIFEYESRKELLNKGVFSTS